ncbi:hypothetical protein NDU88_000342 [Pleurodeles waltl]|uniref:Uncharacterized protein n=1 Tax=Pleurodeles waltl TaxID=8319 RepID=A0AAV7N7M7_PLEWA|nr:hypothetical protein NDU88_000342 [Pleurodeles waltl]
MPADASLSSSRVDQGQDPEEGLVGAGTDMGLRVFMASPPHWGEKAELDWEDKPHQLRSLQEDYTLLQLEPPTEGHLQASRPDCGCPRRNRWQMVPLRNGRPDPETMASERRVVLEILTGDLATPFWGG